MATSPEKAALERVADSVSADEQKFLTFLLADEEYGVPILSVREINGVMSISAVPKMPHYMKGVINLRGAVIPVVDLRLRFGLPEVAHTEQTCIIVVDVGREIGILVDTVSEVLDIRSSDIDPPPQISASVSTDFILGLGKVGDAVKILLDIDRVLDTQPLEALELPTAWPQDAELVVDVQDAASD
jgi:purine-binding chemotaxis protein CheW